jgi:hypothetical protein
VSLPLKRERKNEQIKERVSKRKRTKGREGGREGEGGERKRERERERETNRETKKPKNKKPRSKETEEVLANVSYSLYYRDLFYLISSVLPTIERLFSVILDTMSGLHIPDQAYLLFVILHILNSF